jgi:hypothetical protein
MSKSKTNKEKENKENKENKEKENKENKENKEKENKDNKNVCDKNISFSDCELAILRLAVDKAEEKMGKRVVESEEVQKIIHIVETFIKRKNLICYGGTAINNILPKEAQFYNKDVEIPDYDFFSINTLNDAKELADIYFKEGFTEVEAKSGQHHGTYKVFVNYLPVADITFIPKEIYNSIKKESLRVNGILYAPPNFLRMSMYLELSRPAGDISRWEKVLKRLSILNKYYPLTNINCNEVDLQREMSNTTKDEEDIIFKNVSNTFINEEVVFFGGYAISQYKKYMPKSYQKKIENIADFDVLSNDPESTAVIVKERLKDEGIKNVTVHKKEPVGEIIPIHYEIKVGENTVAFIYKPIGCHSYNIINIKGKKVKIATIDTMLSFYLAFLYTDRPYYNEFAERIICISKFLFEVQQHNRLRQRGILKRFSITCYGHQEGLEELRAEKADKYSELKGKKGTKEYEEWFLNYAPSKLNGKNGAETDSDSDTENATVKKSMTKTTSKSKTKSKSGSKSKSTTKKNKKSEKTINRVLTSYRI